MTTPPVKGSNYEIRYIGDFGWDTYKGQAIATGVKCPDGDYGPDHYEFRLPDGVETNFPLSDVFPIEPQCQPKTS